MGSCLGIVGDFDLSQTDIRVDSKTHLFINIIYNGLEAPLVLAGTAYTVVSSGRPIDDMC